MGLKVLIKRKVCVLYVQKLFRVSYICSKIFMAQLQSIAILCMLMIALGTTVSAYEQESTKTLVIPGADTIRCPSDEDRQAALQLLHSISEQVLRNYSISLNCGPGLWRQVFYLNISNEDQSCPGDWNVQTVMSVRGCAGSAESCQSAFSDDITTAAKYRCLAFVAQSCLLSILSYCTHTQLTHK